MRVKGVAAALAAAALPIVGCGATHEASPQDAENPFLVKDLEPGPSSSEPSRFAPVAGGVVFHAVAGGGEGLWRTDGTASGTIRIDGGRLSSLGEFTAIGGRVCFDGSDRDHGDELWSTDGTSAGTLLVKDIDPGPFVSGGPTRGSSYPRSFVALNGMVLFVACDEEHGYELWRSDGTTDGTRMVKDIYPGPGPVPPDTGGGVCLENQRIQPTDLTPFNGLVYLLAEAPDTGRELWRSDGTTEGTVLVKETLPGPEPLPLPVFGAGSVPRIGELTAARGRLFFRVDDSLWTSDGTPGGTQPIGDMSPTLLRASSRLLFFAGEGGLWTSDGTAAGTQLVKPLRLAFSPRYDNMISDFQPWGDAMFFVASDGLSGFELWRSDGTPDGTAMVKDIAPGSTSSQIENFTVMGSALYFSAYDGSSRRLWRTDGTPAGTEALTDAAPSIAGHTGQFPVRSWGAASGLLLFAATDPNHGTELWGYRPPAVN
jgi:ELWxxDGT repeat protein